MPRASPPFYFLTSAQGGAFDVAGIGNAQRIAMGKAAAHVLPQELSSCQQAPDLAMALVAAKNEPISMLRASHTCPR